MLVVHVHSQPSVTSLLNSLNCFDKASPDNPSKLWLCRVKSWPLRRDPAATCSACGRRILSKICSARRIVFRVVDGCPRMVARMYASFVSTNREPICKETGKEEYLNSLACTWSLMWCHGVRLEPRVKKSKGNDQDLYRITNYRDAAGDEWRQRFCDMDGPSKRPTYALYWSVFQSKIAIRWKNVNRYELLDLCLPSRKMTRKLRTIRRRDPRSVKMRTLKVMSWNEGDEIDVLPTGDGISYYILSRKTGDQLIYVYTLRVNNLRHSSPGTEVDTNVINVTQTKRAIGVPE